jgi:hypothetical protein
VVQQDVAAPIRERFAEHLPVHNQVQQVHDHTSTGR